MLYASMAGFCRRGWVTYTHVYIHSALFHNGKKPPPPPATAIDILNPQNGSFQIEALFSGLHALLKTYQSDSPKKEVLHQTIQCYDDHESYSKQVGQRQLNSDIHTFQILQTFYFVGRTLSRAACVTAVPIPLHSNVCHPHSRALPRLPLREQGAVSDSQVHIVDPQAAVLDAEGQCSAEDDTLSWQRLPRTWGRVNGVLAPKLIRGRFGTVSLNTAGDVFVFGELL